MKSLLAVSAALALSLLGSSAYAAQSYFTATLTGGAEVPPVSTPGTGSAKLSYDATTRRLCGSITYQGLTSSLTLAHLHVGTAGDSGSPFVTFTAGASPIDVDVTLDTTQDSELQAGGAYVNLHTTSHADGEIRGELADDPAGIDLCPPDAGVSSSSSSSSGSNGATTVRVDAGDSPASGSSGNSGCATAGETGPQGPLALAALAVCGLAALTHRRKKR